MAKNETAETELPVTDYINAIDDEVKRKECFLVIQLMKSETGFEPKMWGPSIIGFGSCHYKYESGREGDMPLVCFSPRKSAIVFYLSGTFENRAGLLQSFGKYKSDKGCVYVKKLDDINIDILKKMIAASVKRTQALYLEKKK